MPTTFVVVVGIIEIRQIRISCHIYTSSVWECGGGGGGAPHRDKLGPKVAISANLPRQLADGRIPSNRRLYLWRDFKQVVVATPLATAFATTLPITRTLHNSTEAVRRNTCLHKYTRIYISQSSTLRINSRSRKGNHHVSNNCYRWYQHNNILSC
jgi:hypothetical protein